MIGQALITEFLKLRHSKITWISAVAFSFLPLAGALFVWIVMEPDRAAQLGLMGTKAQLTGVSADWPSYITLLIQEACVGGMVLLAIIASYVFGREYSEETAKNMLALPVPRQWFVVAKFAVIFVWFLALSLLLSIEGYVIGTLVGLRGLTAGMALSAIKDILIAGLVGFLLVPAVTWIATLGRGYLPPIGFTILMLLFGNVFGATGWGKWFPWSIAPMLAGLAGPRTEVLAPGSVVVLALTFVAGFAATVWQLQFSDNTQ